jgi:hypothetical protein
MNTDASPRESNWKRKLIVTGVVVGGVLLGALIASATIPRWWAHQIGDQVDESIVRGTLVGLFYGFLFTILPLLVLGAVLRWRRSLRALVIGGALALLLAIPNLLTLGIVLGTGNAAHAGDRTLDVKAPAFRGASLAGALLAIGLLGLIAYLTYTRDQGREEATTPDR